MKMLVFATVLLVVAVAVADDVTTLEGRTYRNVKVASSDPISITASNSAGIARILFLEMDNTLQGKYDYDAAKAAIYLDGLKARRAA